MTDLIKKTSIIHIEGKEYQVRYSLNALLCLEMCYKPIEEILKTPVQSWSIEDILQLTRAALCDLPGNRKAIVNRDWQSIKPDIFELGQKIDVKDLRVLRFEIADAIIKSLPTPVVGAEGSGEPVDYLKLRTVYCQILGNSEKKFWTSNLSEIHREVNAYMEVKGYKEPVQKVRFEH